MILQNVPLAHSSLGANQTPQSYYDHLFGNTGVVSMATGYAVRAAQHHHSFKNTFPKIVRVAAELHDLGKLNAENQRVLRGEITAPHLPKDHVDAGTAILLERCSEAAITVFSHHRGLPSFSEEGARGKAAFRSRRRNTGEPDFEWSDNERDSLLQLHRKIVSSSSLDGALPKASFEGVARRMALSCLVDADHSDTAQFYDPSYIRDWPLLQPSKRLMALDRYVEELGRQSRANERNRLRAVFYQAARDAEPQGQGIFSCDAPVGSGKTTAIVAHLLNMAAKTSRDRMIIVLPYTNIIDQTVEVLRRALTLPGENPELVVTAHHHRAEFQDPTLRGAALSWGGPIIVTTAVQFFETISGASTGALRKFHRMANACIMIDEAHGCIPVYLWKQHLQWLSELTRQWGAYFVLASGSLCEFWKIRELRFSDLSVPPLVEGSLSNEMNKLEQVRYCTTNIGQAMTIESLIDLIQSKPGPRIVVINTVEGAARVAKGLRAKYPGIPDAVLHLSTALAPRDRAGVISKVKARLATAPDTEWTLVATSCVEAGMDFSFRTGFRERSSLLSFIQLGGRINRSLDREGAELIDFIIDASNWPTHPEFKQTRQIMAELIESNEISNASCTKSIQLLLAMKDVSEKLATISAAEKKSDYPGVQTLCRVISNTSVTVIIDEEIAERAKYPGGCSAREIQETSVQIFHSVGKFRDWGLVPIGDNENLFAWKLAYDPEFLGYMEGVLGLDPIKRGDTIIY